MKSIFQIIFIMYVSPTIIYSQNDESIFKSGVVISVANSIINQEVYELDNGHYVYDYPILKTKTTYFHTYSFGIYYSGKISFSTDQLEIRPGLIFGNSYTGLEFGLFYRKYLNNKVFGIIGLNTHYNVKYSEGNSRGYTTEDGFYFNPNIGLGINIIKPISISFTYEYGGNKRIYSDHYFNPDGPSTRGYQNLEGLFRIGIEL